MSQTIDIQADMSQAIAQMNSFAASLNSGQSAAVNMATGLVQINNVTGEVTQKINGVTDAGTKFTAVLSGIPGNMQVVSTTLEKAKTNLKSLGDELGITSGKSEKTFISIAGMLRLFESQVLRQGFRAVIQQFTDGVKSAAEMSVSIARIQTVSQGANLSTQAWTESIRTLSDKFATPQADVAAAQYFLLQANQGKVIQSQTELNAALKLGQVVNLSAADSAKLLDESIKAYGLTAGDAEKVSATFFKTLQNAAISPQELASGLQKIGPLASSMGIKLEEVNAAIISLTSKGVRGADAINILASAITKGAQPTEEMTKLLTENGFASLSALIAVRGFGGYLALLDKESQSGTARLGELTSKLKGIRTAAGLSGQAFADFNQNLAKVNDGAADFERAAQTIKNSLGKDIQSEVNKIKNFFTNELGNQVLKDIVAVKNVISGDNGLVGGMKILADALKVGAVLWAAYWLNAAGPVGIAFGLGAVAGKLLANDSVNTVPGNIAKATQVEQQRQEAEAKSPEGRAQTKSDNDLVTSARTAYSERLKVIIEYAGKVFQIAEGQKKKALDNLKDIEEAVKVSGKTFTDSITKGIQEMNRQISEARSLIKQSLKISEDLPRQGANAIFAEKLKFAQAGEEGPQGLVINDQKSALLKARIIELTTLAREEFKKGTKEGVEEARKLFSDAQKLETELFTQGVEARKKVGEAQIARGTIPTDPGFQRAVGPDGKVRYEFTVQTAEIEAKINALTRERLDLEENFRKQQEARKKNLEEQAQTEKDRLRTIALLLGEAAKFKVTDDQGKIKKEFKDDPNLAGRQFGELIGKIRDKTTDEEFIKQYQVFSDLYRQRIAIVQQVEAQITSEQAKAGAERAQLIGRTAEAEITKQKSVLETAKAEVAQAQVELAKFLEVINKNALVKDTGSLVDQLKQKFSNPTNDPNRDKAAPEFSAAKAAEAAVLEAREALNTNKTVANAEALIQKLRELKKATEDYIIARTGLTRDQLSGTVLPGERGDSPSIGSRLNSGVQTGINIRDAIAAQDSARAALEQSKLQATGLDAAVASSRDGLAQLGPLAVQSGRQVSDAIQNVTIDTNKLVDSLNQAKQALIDLNAALPAQRGNRDTGGNVQGQMMGGLMIPKYFGSGGYARGSDQIPAMLAKDEFVVNAPATRKFLPQLQAMNSLQAPQFGNQGGHVTNVGDIHVHLTGGSNTPETIKVIADGLRRELKRGTVRIN